MHAQDVFLTQTIQGPKQYLIPIFQRTYSWKIENCEQLFNDVLRVGSQENLINHFIGSVVLIPNNQMKASIPEWQVIDGQQRLTTISILLLALLKQAEVLGVELIEGTPLSAIRDYYLQNAYGQGDSKYKILLTKSDKKTFCALIDNSTLPDSGGEKIKRNFQFFCNAFSDIETISTVYAGLQKVKIVQVTLQTGHDDPQAIFESLNSTGLALSQADLIRNFVLMGQPHDTQTTLYQQYWFPIEQLFGSAYAQKFDRFAQDFLTLSLCSNSLINASDVYPLFKEWYQDEIIACNAELILSQITAYARYYVAFGLLKETDRELREAFGHLRKLAEVATLPILRLYECYENNYLSKKEFIKAIRTLESYVLRRSVCGMQTRSLGNNFAAISQKIKNEAPLESLLVALARMTSNSRFPSKIEFREGLIHSELYNFRTCRFVLERLENNSKEKIDTTSFTIEHVMPQNKELRNEWRDMLGENWKEIQQTWLHRLGNLTLTGYNSEYSDYSFTDKKTIKFGFNDSPLRLNRPIREATHWTETEIRERGEKLAAQGVKIWPDLDISPDVVASYALEEKKTKSANLSLSDVTGIKPKTEKLASALNDYLLEEINSDVSMIISKRNITFYHLAPFVQVVPRKGYLALILAIDFETLHPELQELCSDTNKWKHIRNASLNGIYGELYEEEDIKFYLKLFLIAYRNGM